MDAESCIADVSSDMWITALRVKPPAVFDASRHNDCIRNHEEFRDLCINGLSTQINAISDATAIGLQSITINMKEKHDSIRKLFLSCDMDFAADAGSRALPDLGNVDTEPFERLLSNWQVQHLPKFQALSTIDLTFDNIEFILQEDVADVVSSDVVVLRVNANEGYHTVITHRLTPMHVLESLLPHHFGLMFGIVCFGETDRYTFTVREDREPTVEDVMPGGDVSFLEDFLDLEEEHLDRD
eukprot:TRINITY_DN44214_c0_g1_i1.p1 TRINITY_DN44214_c0_g1~~TRINITY_DN44214_c0_g1_i1.p1  ORF type:complete len:257 (-),score=25.89 TRINITY_DN44214_c0_g1_i1:976-1698(-)